MQNPQLEEQSKMILDLTAKVEGLTSLLVGIANGRADELQSLQGGAKKGQTAENSNLTKEEEEFMRLNKNVRKRKDGRYEWQKMIGGVWYREIDSDKTRLASKIKTRYESISNVFKKEVEQRKLAKIGNRKLVDLAWSWFHRYKEGKIVSARHYGSVIKNYIASLDKNIDTYTKDDIQDFLNDITAHRAIRYVYDTLKNVFAEAHEKGLLKRNTIASLKRPPKQTKKGTWVDLDGQRKILDTIGKCKIGEEVLFYLMTGARCTEALHTTIDFEKCVAFVDGTKTKSASRYVELSKEYCARLKKNWSTMFKFKAGYYSNEISAFLTDIGLSEKTCHSLRHSFSTNLYYLGVNDKKCQHLLGHASITMTRDTYTTYDPTITREDIKKLYGNYYPF